MSADRCLIHSIVHSTMSMVSLNLSARLLISKRMLKGASFISIAPWTSGKFPTVCRRLHPHYAHLQCMSGTPLAAAEQIHENAEKCNSISDRVICTVMRIPAKLMLRRWQEKARRIQRTSRSSYEPVDCSAPDSALRRVSPRFRSVPSHDFQGEPTFADEGKDPAFVIFGRLAASPGSI